MKEYGINTKRDYIILLLKKKTFDQEHFKFTTFNTFFPFMYKNSQH